MLITDYELNRVVLDPKIRQFYAPTVEIADEITALKRTAYGTGIPVHPDFFNPVDKKQTLSDFKLNAEWPTILVMAGGLGLTDSSKLVKYLVDTLEDTNIVAIAGKSNPRSLNKLSKIVPNGTNVYRVIDFTERIAELMRLSSIIITKPGGLTVTESLHLKKPLLLFSPVPGQEDANVRYLEEKKYGRLFSGHTDLLQNINSILRGTHDFCEPSLPPNSAENILKHSLNP
jgi:processive 1,2-diacylglycerol beta-glucosyltransferase